MRRQLKSLIWLVVIGTLVVACGTTREARKEDKEDKIRKEFKVALAEHQVARRRETAEQCRRQGVDLPDKYEQKGGGMLEEYTDARPPCGVPARERIRRAETDFRATWKAVVGQPVPPEYEWLLAVKGRIAIWLDVGGLTPDEARTVLREAQWVLVGWEEPGNPTAASERGSSGVAPQYFASLDTALNRALAAEGIACRKGGKTHACF
jgi:hypothetical protein